MTTPFNAYKGRPTLELSEYEMSRLCDALNYAIQRLPESDKREMWQYLLSRAEETLGAEALEDRT